MNLKVILPTLFLAFFSCRNKDYNNTQTQTFVEPKLLPIYFNKLCQGDSCSYVHFLMLSTYEETNFNNYDFVYLADKYLDSVKNYLPVACVQFCKPFKFDNIGGSENDEQLKQNAITSVWYSYEGKQDKVPEVSSVSIWTNGERKDLDYLSVKSRQKRMEYYDSKK